VQKTILVTGGAGYIGSHTCKALAEAGYLPVALDNLVHGPKWAVKWGPLVEGDLADRSLIDRVFATYDIQGVIHFAAYAYVGESMEKPAKYFHNNVVGTLNLLDSIIANDINYFVFSSTCATYGIPNQIPISEDHPQKPVNPYGDSKLFIEKTLRWYDIAYGLKAAILRYFNAAGADPDGLIGEAHHPETHLIPLVIQATLDASASVALYGTDYATLDGTAIRDYIHVSDLATAHVAALEYLRVRQSSNQFNLGTGRGHSVREVISAIQKYSGRSISIQESPRRPGDPPVLVADASKADKELGWQPTDSDLDTIIRTAWDWHSRQVEK
jgi:UDP-glucose-4-epimerase GalE